MGALNIQSKIKAGLAKAIEKTGSPDSELVYLTKSNSTSTPLNVVASTSSQVLLKDAVFKPYNAKLFSENILAGDVQLVSNNDVVITQGDVITQGITNYNVVSVEIKAPTSEVLAYISQLRIK